MGEQDSRPEGSANVHVLTASTNSAQAMWLTLVLHSAFAAFAVTTISKCDPGHGLIGVQICAVHWASLLGILPGPSFLVHRRLWWRPSPDDTKVMLLFLIGVLHFLGLGVLEFMALEPTKIHTFTDALYFCFVLLTTVGYMGIPFRPPRRPHGCSRLPIPRTA